MHNSSVACNQRDDTREFASFDLISIKPVNAVEALSGKTQLLRFRTWQTLSPGSAVQSPNQGNEASQEYQAH